MVDNQQNIHNQNNNTVGEVKIIRDKLQKNVVDLITRKIEEGEMNEDRAKAIAQMMLKKLPEDIDYETLMRVIPTLDDEFIELKTAVFPIIKEYQEMINLEVQKELSKLLSEQKFSEAIQLAREALEFEKELG